MPLPANLKKAYLREAWLDASNKLKFEKDGKESEKIPVQFNPQTLTLSFSNQVTGANQPTGSGSQFANRGTTTLRIELWFDVTAPLPDGSEQGIDDVRELTHKVTYFVEPQEVTDSNTNDTKYLPPTICFGWGTFLFDGIVKSIDESLEFFSEDGKPLRSKVSFTINKDELLGYVDAGSGFGLGYGGGLGLSLGLSAGIGIGGGISGGIGVSGGISAGAGISGGMAGTQPLLQVKAGATIQGIAAGSGRTGDWKKIALANNIENPRRLNPGTLINAKASAGIKVE